MNSDDRTGTRRDVHFRIIGEGMSIALACFFCGQRKFREGGKMRGPFKNLFSCKACEEKRAQSKHELSGA